ncbi:MAG: hypothetical protein NTW30_06210 [Candidatus Aenigmarchaeota archaeon]|nr:hypothetical protein [Candidatus Aenigmarchaeota archaeon]
MIKTALGLILEKLGEFLQIQDECEDLRKQIMELRKENTSATRVREAAALETESLIHNRWCVSCQSEWEDLLQKLADKIRSIPLKDL